MILYAVLNDINSIFDCIALLSSILINCQWRVNVQWEDCKG